MNRRMVLPLLLAFPFLGGVCDPGTVDVVPELEDRFSFEGGLEGWSVAASGLGEPPQPWQVSVTAAESTDGDQSLRLFLDNRSAQGRAFIRRRVSLVPDTDYRAELTFQWGTRDTGGVGVWNLIAGVGRDEPRSGAGLVTVGDTGSDGVGSQGALQWVDKSATLDFRTAPDDGRMWIAMGLWGTSPFAREYFLDDVVLTIRRR